MRSRGQRPRLWHVAPLLPTLRSLGCRYDAGVTTGRVFRRSAAADPPVAVEAFGSTIRDADGREYLDAAGGAIVVNVGHGRREIAAAMAEQAGRLAYAHGSAFTTEPVEAYAREVGRTCRWTTRRSTRFRAVRRRSRRRSSWRGPTTSPAASPTAGSCTGGGGAITATPWERSTCPVGSRSDGRTRAGSAGSATSRRHIRTGQAILAPNALATTDELAAELDATFAAAEPGTVAAFVAEPIVGATLGAVVPPDGYWPAIADVCRRHGVLLIADEVMTGFGRTGRWFGVDHWGVRPDLLVAAKGATSGYWPFGFVAATGEIHDTVRDGPGFVHGFTYSHAPVGAAVAREVLRILEDESLVEASATKGERLRALATDVARRLPGRRRHPRPRTDGRHRARRRP